jgi:hypothetical protein
MSSEIDNIPNSIKKICEYVDETYGEKRDYQQMLKIMSDPACVFHKTKMVFDNAPLMDGEFAHMHRVDKNPSKGFVLYMHPCFKDKIEALPLLMAYHFVVVNFGDNVLHEHAEALGAGLNKLELEDYYDKLCKLCDSIE